MSTKIQWTDETWNPVTGCDRVSPGCDHCYAEGIATRFAGTKAFPNGFKVTLHPERLEQPLHWRKPRRVFVNSMSDLFHQDVPVEFIGRVWDVMVRTPQHTYQILTKRPQGMARILGPRGIDFYAVERPVPCPQPNIWLGVSVENQRYADLRIPHLLATPAAVRFLSVEPMLGPVDLTRWLHGGVGRAGDHDEIDWVIIGGESGRGARPMQLEWAQDLVEQCQAAGVAVFMKQLGTVTGGKAHHDIDTFPEALRVREWCA